jgi:uncharacterized protein (DUF488 family)
MTIHTIGHSTRPAAAFLELLRAHDIVRLADIRAVPRSRRHPQFDRAALEASLGLHGVAYRHFPALGGRRVPAAGSVNTAWRESAFRGYADYMQTPPFAEAVDELVRFAGAEPTAVMCAEATWWTCHRRLLADALLVRGISVLHIASAAGPKLHELSQFARVDRHALTYPGLL